jgi:signal transduction histidine kinase/ActR/RegA family two-component response regulator
LRQLLPCEPQVPHPAGRACGCDDESVNALRFLRWTGFLSARGSGTDRKPMPPKGASMNSQQRDEEPSADPFLKMQRDVELLESKLRRAQQALKESQQHLQQAQKMEALGTLVAGVAHEINNPINLLIYNLPLLRKVWIDLFPVLMGLQKNEPDRKFGGFSYEFLRHNLVRLIDDMDLAANRVVKIVTDLKNFSKQSNVSQKHSLDINQAVRNALRLAQTTLRTSGVQLELTLKDDLPPMVGNLQSIEQIILNLIINGVQAVGDRAGLIAVASGFRSKDGHVFIRVRDNGSGVSSDVADKLFLPFVTTKHNEGGTGLGLSVSYSLVKSHGGDISFESEPGKGTEFTVSFPTALTRQAAKILIVDDDRMVRKILAEALLLHSDYLIEEASNGIEASIKLGTYRPDLLILDIFMPEMDGVEVCRNIKSEPELSAMKVIITTGYPQHPKLDEVAALGFGHILSKPFDLKEFTNNVRKILSER